MKNQFTRRSPQIHSSLLLLCALIALFGMMSCGGGSGGNGNGNNNNNGGAGRTISGTVFDFTSLAVPHTLIQINGTTLNTTTDNSGAFMFSNVPNGVATLTVTRPGGTGYYEVAQYLGKTYDLTQCAIPIPTPTASVINMSQITLYGGPDASNPPPPPPPLTGCP